MKKITVVAGILLLVWSHFIFAADLSIEKNIKNKNTIVYAGEDVSRVVLVLIA